MKVQWQVKRRQVSAGSDGAWLGKPTSATLGMIKNFC
jgi:malate synthase